MSIPILAKTLHDLSEKERRYLRAIIGDKLCEEVEELQSELDTLLEIEAEYRLESKVREYPYFANKTVELTQLLKAATTPLDNGLSAITFQRAALVSRIRQLVHGLHLNLGEMSRDPKTEPFLVDYLSRSETQEASLRRRPPELNAKPTKSLDRRSPARKVARTEKDMAQLRSSFHAEKQRLLEEIDLQRQALDCDLDHQLHGPRRRSTPTISDLRAFAETLEEERRKVDRKADLDRLTRSTTLPVARSIASAPTSATDAKQLQDDKELAEMLADFDLLDAPLQWTTELKPTASESSLSTRGSVASVNGSAKSRRSSLARATSSSGKLSSSIPRNPPISTAPTSLNTPHASRIPIKSTPPSTQSAPYPPIRPPSVPRPPSTQTPQSFSSARLVRLRRIVTNHNTPPPSSVAVEVQQLRQPTEQCI
ncbi:hypothetical protein DFS34DRAFT_593565 [Phlyctochytrium arcticum]|nr:hypothetical protein DFS34DRAFT_593565 [Phlyctochytrium arcticum]